VTKPKRKKAAPAPAPAPAPPPRAIHSVAPRVMSRLDWKLVAVALGVALVAYLNALDNQFVYDDRYQILKNPTIADPANIPRMFTQGVWQFMNRAAEGAVGAYYRPLFNVALIVNHRLFGLDPFGWHAVSLLLHLGVTAGVYVLGRRWGLATWAAAAAALVFAVHPTHVESVAWASGVPDPLAGALLVGALLVYERYRAEGGWRHWLLGASVALALLAMLTKETAIVFPAFVWVRELLDRAEGEASPPIARAVARAAAFGAAAAVYLGMRYAVLGFLGKVEPKAAGVPGDHVLWTIPSVLVHYARTLAVPYPLSLTYDVTFVASPADVRFWASALALAALVAAAVWLARRSTPAALSLCWLALFLLPVLNLKAFNPDESLVHDRYLYLPSIGFCLLAGMALERLAARFGERREAVFTWTTAGVAAVLLVLTVVQNTTWADDFTMASHAIERDPQRPFFYNYLGAMHTERGSAAEAEAWYRRALELRPGYYDALTNLGDACRTQNRPDEAERYYLQAIEAGAPYYNTRYNLATVYMPAGRYAEAREQLAGAIEIQPTAEAHYALGWVHSQEGDAASAERAYVRALELKPEYPEPRINLAMMQTGQGRHKEALDNLLYVQTLAPQHPVMLFGLGDLYMRTNRFKEALAPFAQLAAIEPRHRLAHTSLGLCYEATGDAERARASFRTALQVAPQEPYTNVAREHLARLGG
jgi:Flp pilus assembly protein TadD